MARLLEREPEPAPTCHTGSGIELYPLLIAEEAETFDRLWASACEHVRARFRERCDWQGSHRRWAWRIEQEV